MNPYWCKSYFITQVYLLLTDGEKHVIFLHGVFYLFIFWGECQHTMSVQRSEKENGRKIAGMLDLGCQFCCVAFSSVNTKAFVLLFVLRSSAALTYSSSFCKRFPVISDNKYEIRRSGGGGGITGVRPSSWDLCKRWNKKVP